MALKPFSLPPPLARWLVFEADNATGGYALRKSYSRLGCLDYPPGSAGSGEFRVAFVRSRHLRPVCAEAKGHRVEWTKALPAR